jgi:hypothetical protein
MSWLNLPPSEGLKDWIKYDEELDAVFCKKCLLAPIMKSGFNDLSKGYTGGKKGFKISDLKDHTKSKGHKAAVQTLQQQNTFQMAKTNLIVKHNKRMADQQNVNYDEWYPYSLQIAYLIAKKTYLLL